MKNQKIEMRPYEAGIILTDWGAITLEYGLVIENQYYLLEKLDLFDNQEVCKSHNAMTDELLACSLDHKYPKIINEFVEIMHSNKDRISIKQLKKVKAVFKEVPTTLEINCINHFNKLKSIKKDEPEVLKAEVKANECIKNIRFLANRVIGIIDSKI